MRTDQIELSPDQAAVYTQMMSYITGDLTAPRAFTLGGLAGTGKSTIIAKVVQDLGGRVVRMCALTGKAVERLRQTGIKADFSTLHGLLFCGEPLSFTYDPTELAALKLENPSWTETELVTHLKHLWARRLRERALTDAGGAEEPEDAAKLRKELDFTVETPWEEMPHTVIVDEASMVSEDIYARLMRHLQAGFGAFGVGLQRLVFVGDHGQLPPIAKLGGAGGADRAFNVVAEGRLDAKLDTIHRQAEHSPIISLAHRIRESGSLEEVQRAVRESPIPKLTRAVAHESIWSLAQRSSWDDVVVIAHTNAARVWTNQQFLSRCVSADGAPVINLRNTKQQMLHQGQVMQVQLANGSRGILGGQPYACVSTRVVANTYYKERIAHDVVRLPFVNFKGVGCAYDVDTWPAVWGYPKPEIPYDKKASHIMAMDWAFCVTCHKAQGSAWKSVFVDLNDASAMRDIEQLKKWLYTAVTRAETNLAFIV
jgi:exodeoxyribonuclease-5